ncbi:unnamed protein product [Prorocentrum cordatum]|uniref:Hint domain-containing protein n=1 Tax=Prorocentrum cordatum TaxID=2364126 RepID=A0ABN9TKS5_9DINO|nr:unnamed protein product [Polarella glacialis]
MDQAALSFEVLLLPVLRVRCLSLATCRAVPPPRRPQDGLARAASRRLGPSDEIDAWTLSRFVSPQAEAGFVLGYRGQLRASLRELQAIRRWQSVISMACLGVQILAVVAAVLLSDRGLICARGMEGLTSVALIVTEVHACLKMKHYMARAFGCEDPSSVWGLNLAGSDSVYVLTLAACVVAAGMIIRWKSLVPLACFTVLGYAAAAYVLGGPDMRLAPMNLLLLTFIAVVACWWRRCSEIQARLLHLSYLREKQLRFSAEFREECLKGRQASGCLAGDAPEEAGGAPAASDRRSLRSLLTAPARLDRAAAGCAVAGAGRNDREAAAQGMDCLPLDAGVWVEGRAEPRALRDLEQGERVLCYDILGGSVRYAEVLEKQVDFREVPWVVVVLDDGTRLAMTADHPVQPANRREAVRAAELAPGSDRVVVHRVVTDPVRVREVSRLPAARERPRGRAYLAVRQPDRHLVLVAGEGAQRGAASMAVCSADVGAVAERRHLVSVRGTFVHVHAAAPEAGQEEGHGCRASEVRADLVYRGATTCGESVGTQGGRTLLGRGPSSEDVSGDRGEVGHVLLQE